MTTIERNRLHRTRHVALMLAASALGSVAVLAAEPLPEAQVTIRAERPTAKVVGHSTGGVPIEAYQITYHLTYTDLDVSTAVGANALKARVRTAAYSLCDDLDKLYPLAEADHSCVQKAEDGAMSQVNAVITMAQAPGKSKAK